MLDKYLVSVVIPTVEMEFDIYIPNNKKFGTIKKYILSSVAELSNNTYTKTVTDVRFLDRESGIEFKNDMYVKDTGIKNGSKIIVM